MREFKQYFHQFLCIDLLPLLEKKDQKTCHWVQYKKQILVLPISFAIQTTSNTITGNNTKSNLSIHSIGGTTVSSNCWFCLRNQPIRMKKSSMKYSKIVYIFQGKHPMVDRSSYCDVSSFEHAHLNRDRIPDSHSIVP